MRRIISVLLCIVLAAVLAVSAGAISADHIESYATVSRSGDCQLTMNVSLKLDTAVEEMTFPVPREATAVTVNGRRVTTQRTEDARLIDLNDVLGGMTGDFTLNISYTLPDVIHNTSGQQLELPLLSGFGYPVETMEFSITLPGPTKQKPAFESGYHKADIEKHLRYTVSGATITGSFTQELKDHETVVMFLPVDNTMFPPTLADIQDYAFGKWGMAICAGLAGLYWLLCLAFWPARFRRTTEPPLGATAGDLQSILYNTGADLHLSILTWAQLGYIVVEQTRKGNVLLHKRMSMGNERRESEQQMFRKLFAKRAIVDTDSRSYALLCDVSRKRPGLTKEMIRRRSGKLSAFRLLASGIGLFGGVCVALALGGGAFMRGLLIFVLGVAGGISGWHMQKTAGCVLSCNRRGLYLGLLLSAVWLLLGLTAGTFSVALWMVLGSLLAGLLLAWGGRRTTIGSETFALTLGFAWHLCWMDREELRHRCTQDSEYFFRILPYAVALGLDKILAKKLGNLKLEQCPYFVGATHSWLYPDEWAAMFRRVVQRMDERSQKMAVEKISAAFRSLKFR